MITEAQKVEWEKMRPLNCKHVQIGGIFVGLVYEHPSGQWMAVYHYRRDRDFGGPVAWKLFDLEGPATDWLTERAKAEMPKTVTIVSANWTIHPEQDYAEALKGT